MSGLDPQTVMIAIRAMKLQLDRILYDSPEEQENLRVAILIMESYLNEL